jgi:predicted phage terminase large subunit-like protein
VTAPEAQGFTPADDEARLLELLRWENGETLRQFNARVSPHLKSERHLEPVLDVFERTRREPVRAIVAMPPRHGKTVTAMQSVAWRVSRDPGLRHAYATYGDSLSVSGSRTMRRLATSAGVDLAKDANALHDWRTEHDGGVLATGVGGPLTGKGVTGIALVDDAFKNRKDAESRLKRDSVWEWFTDVVWTRLEDEASCIVIGTMWHTDDLINRLLTRGAGEDGIPFELIRLPAIAEEGDILGRAIGEALWPATLSGKRKFPIEKLREIERLLGAYSFASLYQQRPRPRGSQIFGEPGRFKLSEFQLDGHRVCICADPAATKKTTSDHTAALVLAVKGYGDQQVGWLLGHLRGQWDIADNPHENVVGVVSRLAELQRQWGVAVVVEAVAGFKAVPQMLRAVDPHLLVVEAPAVTDKFVRAQPAASAWNGGRLLVPTDAHWAQGMIQRFQAFTGQDDPEDDEIDACSHGWNALFAAVDGTPILGGGSAVALSSNPFG